MHNRRPTLIMGIGNLVLQDEGFGVHAIRRLAENPEQIPEGVDLLDGGTAGLHLMGNLQNFERLIVIDAALDGNPTGTVRRLRPNYGDFPPLVTAHEIGLKDVLEALEITGFCPDTELIVVSVEKYTSLGTELSPAVEAALPTACTMALEAASSSTPT
ncbi:MAG: HyaD/HybD family hydrogenase maturation endopeptidase [Paramuribaculum sp.]|nr:HyaD/HybD family hydrogenase maturation endopeptidase [Paramuribaculum sp.]